MDNNNNSDFQNKNIKDPSVFNKDEVQHLIKKAVAGNDEARTSITLGYHKYICKIVSMDQSIPNADKEDAVQHVLSYIYDQILNYNEERGIPAHQFITKFVNYSISHYKRDFVQAYSGLGKAKILFNAAVKKLINEGIENPNVEQIAQKMKWSPKVVAQIIGLENTLNLNSPLKDDDETTHMDMLADNTILNEQIKKEDHEELMFLISLLPKKQQYVLIEKLKGKNTREIGAQLGCSHQYIDIIYKAAIKGLQELYKDEKSQEIASKKILLQNKVKQHILKHNKVPHLSEIVPKRWSEFKALYEVLIQKKDSKAPESLKEKYSNITLRDLSVVLSSITKVQSDILINEFLYKLPKKHLHAVEFYTKRDGYDVKLNEILINMQKLSNKLLFDSCKGKTQIYPNNPNPSQKFNSNSTSTKTQTKK